MKLLSNPTLRFWVTLSLVIAFVVKLIWFIVVWQWLPSEGVNMMKSEGIKPLYYHITLTPNRTSVPVKKVVKKPKKRMVTMKEMKLLALYHSDTFTVITVEYKGKTKVLSVGDSLAGFTLESAGANYALFVRDGKEYRLGLIKLKDTVSSRVIAPVNSKRSSKEETGEVVDAGDRKIIDRTLLEHYTQNIDAIYKDIGIADIKKDGKLQGFRVTFVRKGTPFAKLGLRRNDILKSVNGQALNSYNAAFSLYKEMKNIESVTLVIQRGKEEMELEYEIN